MTPHSTAVHAALCIAAQGQSDSRKGFQLRRMKSVPTVIWPDCRLFARHFALAVCHPSARTAFGPYEMETCGGEGEPSVLDKGSQSKAGSTLALGSRILCSSRWSASRRHQQE